MNRMPGRRPTAALLVAVALVLVTCAEALARNAAANSAPGWFVEGKESKIYYEECGTGRQAVVLLHDGLAHSAVWDDAWPDFCRHFHSIGYDRRGYGRPPAATTWHTEIDHLAALLRQRKVSRAVLVGSSHSGERSIDFTLRYPGVLRQLVLVGAVVNGFPYSDHFLNRGMKNSEPFEKRDVATGLANWAKDRYVLAPGHEAAQQGLLALLTANPQDKTHSDCARPTAPAIGRFNEIRVPTLILASDADIPDGATRMPWPWKRGISGSRRVVVSDVGHLMDREKPEEFSRQRIPFIESNRF